MARLLLTVHCLLTRALAGHNRLAVYMSTEWLSLHLYKIRLQTPCTSQPDAAAHAPLSSQKSPATMLSRLATRRVPANDPRTRLKNALKI